MSKVVNLARFRKQKARADKRAGSRAATAKAGLSKADIALLEARRQKVTRQLDQHRRDDG